MTCRLRRSIPSDKLSACTVDVGGEELLQIVCGAPMLVAGEGAGGAGRAVLPDDLKIKKQNLRLRVQSHGMICSAEAELGWND